MANAAKIMPHVTFMTLPIDGCVAYPMADNNGSIGKTSDTAILVDEIDKESSYIGTMGLPFVQGN